LLDQRDELRQSGDSPDEEERRDDALEKVGASEVQRLQVGPGVPERLIEASETRA
jgi:hypothetical protein